MDLGQSKAYRNYCSQFGKKIDFQGFLGIDVSQEGGGEGGLKETSKGHFLGKN